METEVLDDVGRPPFDLELPEGREVEPGVEGRGVVRLVEEERRADADCELGEPGPASERWKAGGTRQLTREPVYGSEVGEQVSWARNAAALCGSSARSTSVTSRPRCGCVSSLADRSWTLRSTDAKR